MGKDRMTIVTSSTSIGLSPASASAPPRSSNARSPSASILLPTMTSRNLGTLHDDPMPSVELTPEMVGGIADEVLELRMVGRFKGLELEVVGAPRYRRHDRRAHARAGRSDGSRELGRSLPLLVLFRDDPGMVAYPDAVPRIVKLFDLGHQHIDIDIGAGGQDHIHVSVDAARGKLPQDVLASGPVIRRMARIRPADPDHRNRIG